MNESQIQSLVLREIGGRPDCRIFRNNQGVGWCGKILSHNGRTLTLADYRPLHAGLHAGSADLIGWKRHLVRPEDVGRTFGIFLSLEVKGPVGRPSDAQTLWGDAVAKGGGITSIVRSPEEAGGAIALFIDP